MKRVILSAACAALISSAAPAIAADGSLSVCADLSASARDVAFHCRRALQEGGLSPEQEAGAQINLGDALIAIGQPSLALDAFNAAAAIAPSRVAIYVGRARAAEDTGRASQAAADWAEAVRLAPRSVDVRLGLGAFALRRGDHARALEAFSAALSLDPDELDARYNRALTFLAMERRDEAARDFSAVLAADPNDAGAYYYRGVSLENRNDAGAIADFERAAAISPEWSAPVYRAGRALERLGRTEAANLKFRRAFELGHQDPWLTERILSLGG